MLYNTQLTPIWAVTLVRSGADITATLSERLISLSITDNKGVDSDEFDLELDDADGKLDVPAKGAVLAIAIGYASSGLVDKGNYVVDEVTYSGPPNKLSIRGHAAPVNNRGAKRRNASYHATTLGAILRSIASNLQLTAAIAPAIANIAIAHIDQTSEGDLSFATRICEIYGAYVTVKKDTLIAAPHGSATTAKGKAMAVVTLEPHHVVDYSYSSTDGSKTAGVSAYYHDKRTAKRTKVLVGDDAGKVRTLRHTYKDAAQAKAAATAELEKRGRAGAKLSISAAIGYPTATPAAKLSAPQLKGVISNNTWYITQVTHTLDSNGYACKFECESKP